MSFISNFFFLSGYFIVGSFLSALVPIGTGLPCIPKFRLPLNCFHGDSTFIIIFSISTEYDIFGMYLTNDGKYQHCKLGIRHGTWELISVSLFLFPTKHLHQCPIAAVTVYHRLSDLKWQMYSLTALEVRGLKSRCQQGRVPFGGSRSESVPFQLLVEWAPCHSDLCFCYHNITFPSLTLLPLSSAYKGPRDYVEPGERTPSPQDPQLDYIYQIPCAMWHDVFTGSGHWGWTFWGGGPCSAHCNTLPRYVQGPLHLCFC